MVSIQSRRERPSQACIRVLLQEVVARGGGETHSTRTYIEGCEVGEASKLV